MQIVGSNCHACGTPVAFLAEGIPCLRCAITFHRACLQGSTICPKCHDNMAKTAAQAQAEEAASNEALLNSGRRQMHLCLVLLGALVLLNLLVPFVFGSSAAFAVGPWIQCIWLAGLSYWTYTGHVWARFLLAFPALISAIMYATVLWRLVNTANILGITYAAFSLVCAAAIFWLLIGSSRVHYFLAAQRQPPRP